MPKADSYEAGILKAFDEGKLKSVATKSELERLKAAARATAIKDRRVNIRLAERNRLTTPRPPGRAKPRRGS